MALWSKVAFSETPDDLRIDSEYYRPEYLHQAESIASGPFKTLSELAEVSDGNHLSICEKFCKSGIRYLRGQDLSEFFISDDDPIYIPEIEYLKLKRSHMLPGDVLLGIVGTIGSVGFITDRHGPLTGNCKLAIIRSRGIEPEYLAAFFLSRIGQNEIQRRIRGTVQMGLILPDVKRIAIPLLNKTQRFIIKGKVRLAYKKRQESVTLYKLAEQLLFSELGIDDLDLSPKLFYHRYFSDAQHTDRLDAEFFQPKYQRVLTALKSTKPINISALEGHLALLTNGHTPRFHDLSIGDVPFLTAEHVFDFRINYNSEKRILREHHDGELRRTQLREGDCLITIKGRIGNAAIAEDFSGPVNINQDVALFRIKNSLPAYYLMAYLNSPAGKAFTQQYCTGQINPFLGLSNIRLLPVPTYEMHRMQRVASITEETVRKARDARHESQHLLDQAQSMIEDAVSGGCH
jgi:type I restriction enzyme S subunit